MATTRSSSRPPGALPPGGPPRPGGRGRAARLRRHRILRSPAAVVGGRRVRPHLAVARRGRPGDQHDPARDRRHAARRALPPGPDRAGVGDARAPVPGPHVPRHRLRRGAQRGAGRLPWPSPSEQVARMDEALDIIDRLWRGETITQKGGLFRLQGPQAAHAARAAAADLGLGLRAGGGEGGRAPWRRLLDVGLFRARARPARRLPGRVRRHRQVARGDRAARRLLVGARRGGGARGGAQVEGRAARRRLPRGHPQARRTSTRTARRRPPTRT